VCYNPSVGISEAAIDKKIAEALDIGGCRVNAEGRTVCKIYDMKGSLVKRVEAQKGDIVNVDSYYADGMYVLKMLTHDGKSGTIKFKK